MQIHLQTIDHADQRYDTCGDYQQTSNGLKITVSTLPKTVENSKSQYEFLIGLHEIVEAYLATIHEVDFSDIDRFDNAFEAERKEGDTAEPGDSPNAPYHEEHKSATEIEKHMAQILNIDWETYEKAVSGLEYKKNDNGHS